MNEILQVLLVFYVFGFPVIILSWFANDLSYTSFKEFYFDNDLVNELNLFGKFCYYILTSFCLFYYYVWIILSWFVKLVFFKQILINI